LKSSQAVFISASFVVFSSLCVFGLFGTGIKYVDFTNQVEAMNPEQQFMASYPMIYIGTAVSFVGILASLKFMWDVRHPKA
jgi:hypothetical protein